MPSADEQPFEQTNIFPDSYSTMSIRHKQTRSVSSRMSDEQIYKEILLASATVQCDTVERHCPSLANICHVETSGHWTRNGPQEVSPRELGRRQAKWRGWNSSCQHGHFDMGEAGRMVTWFYVRHTWLKHSRFYRWRYGKRAVNSSQNHIYFRLQLNIRTEKLNCPFLTQP